MGTPAFDTLQFVRRLKTAGFPDAQAESLVTKIDLERADIEHLGQELKQEISTARQELKAEIDSVHHGLKADMESLRQETAKRMSDLDGRIAILRQELAQAQAHLIKWMVGLALAQLGMLAAILVKLA